MQQVDYINLLKEKFSLRYDYQVADMIGVNKVTFSRIKKSREFLTDKQQAKIADLLNIEPGIIHMVVEAERTDTPSIRSSLERLLKQIPTAAALAVFCMVPFMSPTPAMADSVNFSPDSNIHYANYLR